MREKTGRLSKLNTPAIAGLWYTLSSVIERGSAVILTPIYTRLLLPDAYGVYSLYISILGIVGIFATLEISGSAVYRGLAEFEDKDRFIASALGLILAASIASFLIYLSLYSRINAISGLESGLMIILFLQAFLSGVRALKISEARFRYNKRLPLIESLFFSLFTPTVSFTLIAFYKRSYHARIYASLASSLIFAIPIIASILKRGRMRIFDRRVWAFLLRYAIPSLPHYISTSLIWQIGKITVGSRISAQDAGKLSLAASVGLVPTLLTLGMQSALIPWITRRLSERDNGINRIYSLISSVFSPLCLLITIFLLLFPEAFYIIIPKAYHSAISAVYPIAASVPISFLSCLLSSEISYYKKMHLVASGSLVGATFSVFCNLLFTKSLGFEFPALLIPISHVLITCIYILILKVKFRHLNLPAGRLLFSYFLFLLLVAAAYLLRATYISRILLSAAAIMLTIPKIKTLKPLLSE